jgi:hypothetical protein
MRPHHAQTRDMSMLHSIGRIFFHFGEYITYDSRVVVRSFLGSRNIDCDKGELGPGKGMVEVVFHEITVEHEISFVYIEYKEEKLLFWQICNISMLNMRYI